MLAVAAPSVGGRAMREGKPLVVRTFACAVYLCGRGLRPISAALATEGLIGDVVFIFPPEAADALAEYHQDREAISRLMAETRKRR
jgi:hypothetical protein